MDVPEMSAVPVLVVTSETPTDSPTVEEAAMATTLDAMDTLSIPGRYNRQDSYRPFLILQEEENQARLTGLEALKSHILAARSVALKLRSSLGPKGMDKMLVTPDGEVVITNDGATILDLMDPEHEVAKLMVSLAQAQDREVGDGTTGVIVLAGALLERSLELLDKGVHPTRIAIGFERAARAAAAHLDNISFKVSVGPEDTSWLWRAATTALSSKIASKCQYHLAEIAVHALKTTCNLESPNPVLNANSVVLRGRCGGQIEDSELIRGVIIQGKSEIKSSLQNIKVAVFSGTALQLPNAHTKHQLNVQDMKDYNELKEFAEKWWSEKVLLIVQESGADLVIYSGKIDETLNNLFSRNGILAIDSVADIEMIAVSVAAHVIPKVEELLAAKLGKADRVRLIATETNNDTLLALEQYGRTRIATILVRGSNPVIVEEVKRSLQDAVCVVRNLIKNSSVVYGGGAAEVSCSIFLQEQSVNFSDLDQLIFQAFAEALDAIPLTLAENTGLYPLQVLTELKASHRPSMGVDCMCTGDPDMANQGVVEGSEAKKHQIVMATQLVKMILKIDDVRGPKDEIRK